MAKTTKGNLSSIEKHREAESVALPVSRTINFRTPEPPVQVLGNRFDDLTPSHAAARQGISQRRRELVFVDRAGR